MRARRLTEPRKLGAWRGGLTRRHALAAVAGAPLYAAGCAPRGEQPNAATRSLRTETAALTETILAEAPETATALGAPYAKPHLAGRLADYSAQAQDRRVSLAAAALRRLEAIAPDALSAVDRLTRSVALATLGDWTRAGRFGYGVYGHVPPQPYVVTHISGSHATTPAFLDSLHTIATTLDAENYLSRLAAYGAGLRAEDTRITADAARGVVPPSSILDQAIARLQAAAQARPEESNLVRSVARRMSGLPGRAVIVARATALAANEIIPAYRRQISALSILRSKATAAPGVRRLPQGEQYYAAALRAWTSSDLSPAQVRAMGLGLVQRYHGELDALLTAQRRAHGTVGERLAKLAREPAQRYPNTDAGRAEALRDVTEHLAVANAYAPLYFASRVRARLEVRRAPALVEADAPGGYYLPPALTGRPGVIYLNLRDMAETPRFALATLAFHEGVPGHHWQMAATQESPDIPLLRGALLRSTGFTEGWALYAEQLADEMGVYRGDALGRLGYLQSMTFRAARLVVDTGIHADSWTRKQAIDYMVNATGMEPSAMATEVDRYTVWPGRACSYMVGLQALNAARARAHTALGRDFDIRAFHDALLRAGPIPLTLLAATVDAWIASAGGRA